MKFIEYNKSKTPVYIIEIPKRPSSNAKWKKSYQDTIKEYVRKKIDKPIKTDDIEVDIFYSTWEHKKGRMDIGNIQKPTLDAMNGIAYRDDKQVRSVSATVFDKNKNYYISGRVEYLEYLFYQQDYAVLIIIYSDSRLQELGGEEKVNQERFKKWERKENNKKEFLKRLTTQST